MEASAWAFPLGVLRGEPTSCYLSTTWCKDHIDRINIDRMSANSQGHCPKVPLFMHGGYQYVTTRIRRRTRAHGGSCRYASQTRWPGQGAPRARPRHPRG